MGNEFRKGKANRCCVVVDKAIEGIATSEAHQEDTTFGTVMIIIPAILSRTRIEFEARLKAIKPYFDHAQVDVLNDTLIAGLSYADPRVIEELRGAMRFDIHCMVSIAEYDIERWRKPWVDKIIIHIESGQKISSVLKEIRSWGKQAYLAVNPDTGTAELDQFHGQYDGVQFMTVKPGSMGNAFHHGVVSKIRAFKKNNPDMPIDVDGGVDDQTIKLLRDAGVSSVIVGSYLSSENIGERLKRLQG